MFGVAQLKIRPVFCGVSLVLLVNALVLGQTSAPNDPNNVAGFTAQENNDTAGLRAPGRMVLAGIARQQTAIISPSFGFDIVETSFPLNPRQVFLIDAIQIIFEQLNQAIVLFQNVLLARAGEPPVIPPNLFPSGTSGTQGTGDAADMAGDMSATEDQADGTTDGQDSSDSDGSTATEDDGRTSTRKVQP